MSNNWKTLWENKYAATQAPDLGELIAMVGWKTDDGDLPVEKWLAFVDVVADKLHIKPGDHLLEVGCGPGGFLLPFYARGHVVSGIDYSENLIKICHQVMPNGVFFKAEANQVPVADASQDAVFSNSVFHYFPDHAYAEAALIEMFRCLKPGGHGAVLDINDNQMFDAFMQHRYERFGGKESHDKQNVGLSQLFYERSWMMAIAERNGLACHCEDQAIDWYRNTAYRFNFFFSKP